MAPQDRERFIIDHATRFFAEQGLDGQTRELAKRLGVTQSLIYRYFPSKEALIERVYEKCWTEFWNPSWPNWLVDRRQTLEQRLERFYRDYVRVVYHYDWVRLFAFSGMSGRSYHERFVARVHEQIYPRIAAELRHDHGLPSLEEMPLTLFEVELIWGVQSTAFYLGQRKWLFGLSVPVEVDAVVEARLRAFLATAPQQIAAHLALQQPLKMASD
ncbi:MAG TPA: helix-turn-helix domain-containing protein [Polyangiaceae bacterium]|jgi:AcrR family transcriptional regulator|nr:helix-turn-helix domain-containing protein [Polyangiaceae bacterium]